MRVTAPLEIDEELEAYVAALKSGDVETAERMRREADVAAIDLILGKISRMVSQDQSPLICVVDEKGLLYMSLGGDMLDGFVAWLRNERDACCRS